MDRLVRRRGLGGAWSRGSGGGRRGRRKRRHRRRRWAGGLGQDRRRLGGGGLGRSGFTTAKERGQLGLEAAAAGLRLLRLGLGLEQRRRRVGQRRTGRARVGGRRLDHRPRRQGRQGR